VSAGPRDQEWNAFIVPSRFFDANHSSLLDASWYAHHLFRRQLDNREGQRMRSFVAASAARYEGIVDTFVQLFPPRSAGLIAHVQRAEAAPS
jgi:hypothetical protein